MYQSENQTIEEMNGRPKEWEPKAERPLDVKKGNGRGEEIWTPDFLVPNQARYQAALLPDNLNFLENLDTYLNAVTYILP